MTVFAAGVSCIFSTPLVSKAKYPIFGVDVSHYQGDIDWSALERQGVRFTFIKATEGSGHIDESVRENLADSAKTGIKRSCYHFFSFDSPGETQAQNFISVVGADEIDMPPVVDIEYYGDKALNKPTQEETEAILSPLLEQLEAYYGCKPIIYTTLPMYIRYIRSGFTDYPLWIRSVTFEPDLMNWKFWQYDDTGQLYGYFGEESCIDFNVYNGTEREFEAEFNS
ncbi:MAG: glycosyl hydrolase family 25 [Ruminococcus sp.]|nr:glycosyl hydrolase family 25 [Ruminococcus sp.]